MTFQTYADMMAEIQDWMSEVLGESRMISAINDAVQSLWQSVMLVHLGYFLGGPVNVSFAAGADFATITSINDPTDPPVASNVVQANALGVRTLRVAYTLVTESGSETLMSPSTDWTPAVGNVTNVAPPAFVEGTIGWNLYAQLNTARRARQNSQPISYDQSWREPLNGISQLPTLPEPPVVNNTADDVFYIRQLELAMTGGGFRTIEQGDIASSIMQKLGRSIASPSEFQTYMVDLVNQTTLQLRPAAGATINPRYFYIRKPRRARFKQATFPFQTLDYWAFVRYKAMATLKATLEEWEGSKGWDEKAELERTRLMQVLLEAQGQNNQRITPYGA